MNKFSLLVLSFVFVACASGEKASDGYDRTGLKVTLDEDEKAYLAFPQYRKVTLSPSGKYLVVATNLENQTFVSILDKKTGKILGTTELGENFDVRQFFWVNDDRIIINAYYVEGYLKGEPAHQLLFSVNRDGKGFKQIYPKNRKDYSANLSKSSFRIIHDELIDGEFLLVAEQKFMIHSASSRLSLINIRTGHIRLHDVLKMKSGAYGIDNKIRARIAVKSNKDLTTTFVTKNLISNKWEEKKFWSKKSRPISILGFEKNNKTFYFLADNKKTMRALYKANLSKKGEISDLREVYSYPEGDILNAKWDKKAKVPLYVEYGFGKPMRKYFSNSQDAKILKGLSKSFAQELVYMGDRQGSEYLVIISSDERPVSFYIYDDHKKTVNELLSSNEKVRKLPKFGAVPFSLKARDGVHLHGYFYKPKNWSKSTPMIVHPHGGPYEVRDEWGYTGDIQFFLSRGYSVMQVNFRGSGGQGRRFVELGYKKQGTTMQHDLVDAVKWVNKKGWATRGKACLWGISYGGYASIMSTMLSPEYFACGVGFGGVYDYDLKTKKGDVVGWESKEYFFDRTMPKGKNARRQMSPIGHVSKLKRPIYLLHGEEDVRVTVSQARVLKEELDKHNKDYKYQEFPGVGHWFKSDQFQKYQAFSEIIGFLDQNLKSKN